MKKVVFVLVLIAGGFFYFTTHQNEKPTTEVSPSHVPSPTVTPTVVGSGVLEKEQYLFVPYWSFKEKALDTSGNDILLYFGITVNEKGIDKTDVGYQKLAQFIEVSHNNTKKFLTLRMVNSDTNAQILKDKVLQSTIVRESVDVVKKFSFDGIVLDFEQSALPLESVIHDISDFYRLWYQEARNNNVLFYSTLYGDVFYRYRPYDVSAIANNSDRVLIMAYDFHKAGGNPGPNFPFEGKDVYGYDFKEMVGDFLKIVPKEKITIVFGLFGYDWSIDEEGRSIQQANAFSLAEIEKKFLPQCKLRDCMVRRDPQSAETEIRYIDENLNRHEVWFENMESVAKKEKYFLQKNVTSIGFWAYSYF